MPTSWAQLFLGLASFAHRDPEAHVYSTDRIRSTARRHAWYRQRDDPPNYNPFQKIHRPFKTTDIEDGRPALLSPGTYASADYVDSPTEERRKSQFGAPDRNPRAQTFPNNGMSPGIFAPPTTGQAGASNGTKENSEDSNTRTESTLVDGTSTQVRKRTFLGGLSSKLHIPGNKDKEANELERTVSKKSKSTKKFTPMSQIRATIFNSWINILIIAAPVGIALNYVKSVSPVVVFVVNFIAIIPLAAMLSYATEEIALRTGETIGGLLNATFG